ncbi:protein dachsous-like [Argopecten irradians]|uniref:protein dachsous-like n=1 Tax=Argopecten irradians TaxID=31199 RepID=UPI00371931A3
MMIPTFLSGLFGFLFLLQHCTGQDVIPNIEISDRDIKKDSVFYTVNCTLVGIPSECAYFMYLNYTDLNKTDLHMKIDLLSNCDFIGRPCSFQCDSGRTFTLKFSRKGENIHPINSMYTSYTINVPESTGTDVVLFEFSQDMIQRSDCYSSDFLVFFLLQTYKDVFEIRGTPPLLYLKSRLDYEKSQEYNITVMAILYDQNATTEFIINVEDVDDMDPEFINAPYSLNVTENDTSSVSKCHQTTPPVLAEDRDKGQGQQNLTYSIASGSTDIFDIDNKTGCILLKSVLMWKKSHPNMYHLTIKATQDNDIDRYATSSVNVYVIDTNNHRPKFSQSYQAVIDEHARAGSYVIQVQAQDGDEGVFGEISYAVTNSDGLFTIDNKTGVITVENSTGLDRETFPNITLEVQAIDVEANEVGDTTTVVIDLNDVNDHTPMFMKNYTFHISSTDTAQVSAEDEDIGGNGRVSYELSLVPPSSDVKINHNNGTIYFTDIHIDELTFFVTACDNPEILNSRRCSFTRVQAFLNGTIAGSMVKNMSVAENSPPDTVVGSIDINGATFSILEQDVPFGIGKDKFVRTTTSTLDREKTSHYTFTVTVTGKVLINITVNVEVLDVNDNPPLFDDPEYKFGIPSDNSPLGIVHATDADLGENSNISYSFQPLFVANKYFTIDSRSGEITLSGTTIPAYQASFQLAVLAFDNGFPQMQSLCSVYISRITTTGNYTVSIGTTLSENELKSRVKDLERDIGNILNLTIKANVPTSVSQRTAVTLEPRAVLEISATYKNGTRVPGKELQRVVLIHLSEIEALWAKNNDPIPTSSDNTNVSEIALIVVAGVMLLGALIAVIVLFVKWRQYKAQEKLLRLNESLTRRSSLYESQEIKVRMDDETSDYNDSLNTQDLETYDNGQRPVGDLHAFENPVYKGGDTDETKVKAQAINEALLSLNDLSDRLEEEEPKEDYDVSGSQNVSNLDQNGTGNDSGRHTDDLNTYDTVEPVKHTNSNPYENIAFEDEFPNTSGFAGLKIDGKMIKSSGEGHEEDVVIEDTDFAVDDVILSGADDIPEDEPDVDYHLKQVRFANRVVNADTNIAEELKPDQSEIEKGVNKKEHPVNGDLDNDDTDDDKAFLIKAGDNDEYENDTDFRVDRADTSIRMDEEINSPIDFLKSDDNVVDAGEDSGTFVFGEEETTAL